MKVVSWNQYRMRRDAQRNGGPTLSLGGLAPATPGSRASAPSSDRIRMDCLHRYVRAQLLPRSGK
jgi:hypothetical protein